MPMFLTNRRPSYIFNNSSPHPTDFQPMKFDVVTFRWPLWPSRVETDWFVQAAGIYNGSRRILTYTWWRVPVDGFVTISTATHEAPHRVGAVVSARPELRALVYIGACDVIKFNFISGSAGTVSSSNHIVTSMGATAIVDKACIVYRREKGKSHITLNPSRRCLTCGEKWTFCRTGDKKCMHVLDKVQVFKEIVFNREKEPPFSRFCCTKVGHFALFAFLIFFQSWWTTASLKQKFYL